MAGAPIRSGDWAQTHAEGRPCEDTGRRRPSVCKPKREVSEAASRAGTLVSDIHSLQNCEKISFCYKRHPSMAFCYAGLPNEYNFCCWGTIATLSITTTVTITTTTPSTQIGLLVELCVTFLVYLTPHDQQIIELSLCTSYSATRWQNRLQTQI